MPTEMERLVVTLEASIKQYERALAKANGTTVSTLRKIENNVAKSEKKQATMMARMGQQMGGSLAGMLPAVNGLTGAAGLATAAMLGLGTAIAGAVKAGAALGDMAEDLGVSTDFVQAWQKQVAATGASIEDADKALYKMVAQVRDADSPMRKLFEANKIDITGKSIEEVIKLFIELVSRIDDAGARAKFMEDELGAKLARKLTEAFRDGSKGIEEAQNRIHEGTEGWTAEEIKTAQKIETEWNAMWARIDVAWKGKLLELVNTYSKSFTEPLVDKNGKAVSAVQQAWENYMAWWKANMSWLSLPQMPATNDPSTAFGRGGKRGPIRPDVAPGFPSTTGPTGSLTEMQQFFMARGATRAGVIGLKEAFGKRLMKAMIAAETATGSKAMLSGFPSSLKRSRSDQERIWRESLHGTRYAAARPGHSRHEIGEAADLAKGPARDWIKANLERFGLRNASLKNPRFDLPHVQLAAGEVPSDVPANVVVPPDDDKANKKKKETNKLIQDRIGMLETLIDKEAALKDQASLTENEYVKNIERSGAELEELNAIAADAFGGFIDDLMSGVKAGDAFNNMLKRLAASLAQMAVQMIFSGGGQPGGLLGALFGGGSGVAAQGIPGGQGLLGAIFGGGFGGAKGIPGAAGLGTPGFARGGRFRVRGAGGTDSQLVAFRATPGEEVNVSPRGLRRHGAGMPGISLGGATINVQGDANESTVQTMRRMLARHSVEQRRALERDWGVLSLRYSRLRAP